MNFNSNFNELNPRTYQVGRIIDGQLSEIFQTRYSTSTKKTMWTKKIYNNELKVQKKQSPFIFALNTP